MYRLHDAPFSRACEDYRADDFASAERSPCIHDLMARVPERFEFSHLVEMLVAWQTAFDEEKRVKNLLCTEEDVSKGLLFDFDDFTWRSQVDKETLRGFTQVYIRLPNDHFFYKPLRLVGPYFRDRVLRHGNRPFNALRRDAAVDALTAQAMRLCGAILGQPGDTTVYYSPSTRRLDILLPVANGRLTITFEPGVPFHDPKDELFSVFHYDDLLAAEAARESTDQQAATVAVSSAAHPSHPCA
jgi:hypothetical protein